MLGWFAPKPPVPTAEKVLAERRMKRLAGLLGFDRLLSAHVVLPTPEFFPDPFTSDDAGAAALLARLCGYMGVAPTAVLLEVRPDDDMTGAAGLYEAGRPSTMVRAAVTAGQFEQVNETLTAMAAVTPNVRAAVREHVADPEFQRQAWIALDELGLS